MYNDLKSQIKDAAIAIEACKILNEEFPIEETAIRQGLKDFSLICRGEWFGNVLIDGAHNIEAIEDLSSNLSSLSNGRPIHVLFASFRDKNIAAILPALANFFMGRGCGGDKYHLNDCE